MLLTKHPSKSALPGAPRSLRFNEVPVEQAPPCTGSCGVTGYLLTMSVDLDN